ncbi:MAG: hypothetical protein WAW37_12965 [Syntrophobacteraceae bacterium]
MKINPRRMKIWAVVLVVMVLLSGIGAEPCGAQSSVWDIFQISKNGMFWSQVDNTLCMAGKVGLQTFNYYSATGWVALALAAESAAGIAGIVIKAAVPLGVAGGLALYAYAVYKGLEYLNGVLTGPDGPMGLAQGAPSTGLDITVPGANQPNQVSYFASGSTAYAAAVAYRGDTVGVWNGNVPGLYEYWAVGIPEGYGAVKYFIYSTEHPEYLTQGMAPLTAAQIKSLVAADSVSMDDEIRRLAQGVASAAVDAVADPYNEWRAKFPPLGQAIPVPGAMPAPPPQLVPPAAVPGMTAADLAAIRDLLRAGVPPIVITQKQAQDIAANKGKDVTDPLVNPVPLTKADVKDGVKQGVNEAAQENVGDIPTLQAEGNPAVPSETPIPGYLDNFWNAIRSLPVVSLLTNIQLTAGGGSPVVQLQMPYCFTEGSFQLSMNFNEDGLLGVNYGYFLGLMGNILLAFCGVRWTMYLFSSGE